MNFAIVEKYLADLQMFGIKLGLDNVNRLAEYAGVGIGSHLLEHMHFIHIAGSNGKGSSGAMLEAMLRSSGRKTGFYTSPHLINARERIRINGCAVCEEKWCNAFNTVYAASERMRQEGICPTYFEFQTIFALVLFAAEKVEWVLWETGMGGRLDATNFISKSDYCLITGIALEHCQYLGDTLEKIAAEKSGIIKAGSRVFAGVMPEEALQVIASAAKSVNAPLVSVNCEDIPVHAGWQNGKSMLQLPDGSVFTFALAGAMQRRNCALVLKVWENICAGDSAGFRKGLTALAEVRWPCRFEFIAPGSVIDGGHNPDGIRAFVEACREAAAGGLLPEKLHLIFGAFADKDVAAELEILAGIASAVTFVPVAGDGKRESYPGRKLMEIWKKFSQAPCFTASSVVEAWKLVEGIPRAVCGSLFIAGELLASIAGRDAACDLIKQVGGK